MILSIIELCNGIVRNFRWPKSSAVDNSIAIVLYFEIKDTPAVSAASRMNFVQTGNLYVSLQVDAVV
jgi:hypothetical protein